jgi:hypothetical protein
MPDKEIAYVTAIVERQAKRPLWIKSGNTRRE